MSARVLAVFPYGADEEMGTFSFFKLDWSMPIVRVHHFLPSAQS